MTSDGIDSNDWDTVKDFSAKVVNAVMSNDNQTSDRLTRELLQYLSTLEEKYGMLPSLLATRADFTDDFGMRIRLLSEAWNLANRIGDKVNLVLISSSLAQLFVDELHQVDEGKKWLTLLEESLGDYWDDQEYNESRRIAQCLKELKGVTH